MIVKEDACSASSDPSISNFQCKFNISVYKTIYIYGVYVIVYGIINLALWQIDADIDIDSSYIYIACYIYSKLNYNNCAAVMHVSSQGCLYYTPQGE